MSFFSSLSVPLVLCLFAVLLLATRKKDTLSAFTTGAEQGLRTTVSLLPTLILLMVGISMFSASGLPERLAELLSPITEPLGIPGELLPLLLLRPVSGSGSTAMLTDLFDRYGADSLPGLCASILMGSSETLLYVFAVYFGSVGVRRTRHAFPTAFLVMMLCIFLSCAAGRRLAG